MIGSDYMSKSAHRHARRQQIDFRIKEINLNLIRLVAERSGLVKERDELPRPEPEVQLEVPVAKRGPGRPPAVPVPLSPEAVEEKKQKAREYIRNYNRKIREEGGPRYEAFLAKRRDYMRKYMLDYMRRKKEKEPA
jgi:hypothetical protein